METLNERITKHPFFEGMKPEHLAMLTRGAKELHFNPGDVIFREGEPADHFYLIQSGKIAIEARKPGGFGTVQNLAAGDVLGWSWLYPPFSWHFQARAIDSISVISLSGGHLLVTAENNHDFGYELMKRISRLTIARLQATRKLMLELQFQAALEG